MFIRYSETPLFRTLTSIHLNSGVYIFTVKPHYSETPVFRSPAIPKTAFLTLLFFTLLIYGRWLSIHNVRKLELNPGRQVERHEHYQCATGAVRTAEVSKVFIFITQVEL